jgi:hypothetical protein
MLLCIRERRTAELVRARTGAQNEGADRKTIGLVINVEERLRAVVLRKTGPHFADTVA